MSETLHEPCQRQITAQDLRQDAPTDGLSVDPSQTGYSTSASLTTVSLQLTAGTAPSITLPPG